MNLPDYPQLRDQLVTLGYYDEMEWAQIVHPVTDADIFWREFAWVVLNRGTFEGAMSASRPSVVRADRRWS